MSHAAAIRRVSCRRQRGPWLPRAVPDAGLLLCLFLLLSGCGSRAELETAFGHRRGNDGSSVNGTCVLAGMFEEAGMPAVTLTYLSSRLDKYDVLVWAPNDFAQPRTNVREFLDSWLTSQSGRTLVYIGRDYDAACDYWQQIAAWAPADQRFEVLRRLAKAQSAHDNARVQMPKDTCCEWFVTRRDYPGRYVRQLDGPWSGDLATPDMASHGMDTSRPHIWSQGRLEIPTDKDLATVWKNTAPSVHLQPHYRLLLTSGSKNLVFEVSKPAWGKSKILVVANGSFLLNLPLVNHQHRLLAGKLIDSCQAGGTVAFLESDADGPLLLDTGLAKNDEEVVRRRVLLAAHWLVLGVLFCFSVFPIFGRPKSMETETVADFGQHIDALAALLERTGDSTYAHRQLDLYRKASRGEKDSLQSGPIAFGSSAFPEDAARRDAAGRDTVAPRAALSAPADGEIEDQP